MIGDRRVPVFQDSVGLHQRLVGDSLPGEPIGVLSGIGYRWSRQASSFEVDCARCANR